MFDVRTYHWFALRLLFLHPWAVLGQTKVDLPENITAQIGENITIECNFGFEETDVLAWKFNDKAIYIAQNDQEDYFMDSWKYSFAQDGETFRMTVNILEYGDGGQYTCILNSQRKTMVLLVLETPRIYLASDTSPKQDKAIYTCKACFGGPTKSEISPNHFPNLLMFMNDKPMAGQVLHLDPRRQGDYHLLARTVFLPLKAKMNGSRLTCEIKTDSPNMALKKTNVIQIDAVEQLVHEETHVLPSDIDLNPVTEYMPGLHMAHSEHWTLALKLTFLVCLTIICLFAWSYLKRWKKKKLFFCNFPKDIPLMQHRDSMDEGQCILRENVTNSSPLQVMMTNERSSSGKMKDSCVKREAKTTISDTQPGKPAQELGLASGCASMNQVSIGQKWSHGSDTGSKNGCSNMDEKIGLNIINEIRLDCEYATIPNVKENPAQALPEGNIKEAFCRSPTLRLLSDHLKSTKDNSVHTDPPLSPDHVLSAQEVKMSKMFNGLYKSVTKNCEQLLEEGEEYSNQLSKVYLARGMIATVEKALEDWLVCSG